MRPLLLMLLLFSATAQAVTFTSPEHQVPTIELFTSQGCSSCPPADRWLSRLVDHPGLWKRFIPLAFHVDYWDYIGWKDRFAKPRHTMRQQLYKHWGSLRSVYTPGFVLRGSEWRGFFHREEPTFSLGPKIGAMTLEVKKGQPVKVRFSPAREHLPGQLVLNLTILGFDFQTPVKRGENSGKRLKEDFVVIGSSRKTVSLSEMEWRPPLPKTMDAAPKRKALVAWLSNRGSPAPLQAVGGWLPEMIADQ